MFGVFFVKRLKYLNLVIPIYLDPPRGAKWMALEGAIKQPLRV